MKKKIFGLREFVILAVIIIACYSIWPSIQVHTKSGEAKKTFVKENPKLAEKSVNFGLDLAGGTSITLEIDASDLPGENVKDLQEQSLEIVRNRVDQYGLSEPQISPQGDDRIVVELAGVDDSTAKELVGSTAKLEFKIVSDNEKFTQVVNLIDSYLGRQANPAAADSASPAVDSVTAKADSLKDTSAAVVASTTDSVKADSSVTEPVAQEQAVAVPADPSLPVSLSSLFLSFGNGGFVAEESVEQVKRLLELEAVQKLIPRDVMFAFGSGLEKISPESAVKAKRLYLLKRRAEMDGEDIADARPYRVGDGVNIGEVAVNLKFSGVGPKQFSAVTAANVGKQMAIVLDNQVISAPVIRDRIPNGEAQITGLDDMAEANRLSVVLRAGALKAPMNIIESRNIGATLGEDNIKSGFGAGFWGLVACIVFMVAYYRIGGLIACFGIVLNAVVTAAVLSVFNATLTLPGIVGFILVLGMALDANVIIYERIREEMKAGSLARAAVAKGYERAFSAIFDSNLTTFLTALILYKIGTGSVKGFGLTLMIGIATSLFCSLTVTRAIFDWRLAKNDANKLSIGKGFRVIDEANLPIIKKSKVFAIFSAILLVASLGIMIVRGFDFSIDFLGGQVYTVQYSEAGAHEEDLSKVAASAGLTNAKVRSYGDQAKNMYQISLKKTDDATVKDRLQKALDDAGQKAQIIASDEVGPTIGKELRFNAILSIILSWIAICLYIWFRFGKLGLGFGVGALVGLIHDTIISIGFISLMGLSVDGALIASVLTLIGYTINDKIVVFDRIRENSQIYGRSNFPTLVNSSINQCFSRTIITSMTTLFVCLILAVMGGSSIRDFGLVMVVGIIVGTYSSITISSPFVVWWAKRFRSGV
ncbi:MAG: protein translocase subunit SecD [Fibrobacteraceae bacterium]|nr:protein translocase subunit SecD [Fibrobacteraceae bacterium]